jgi:PAS domain S-box-containing protein
MYLAPFSHIAPLFFQETFWREYRWYIILMIAAIIIEALLIAWLIFMRDRRRKAEEENLRLSSRLEEIVANVPGIVWETRTDPVTKGRKTTFISDYVQRMLGYTPDEWLAQPPGFGFALVADEDRERARHDSEAVVTTGRERVSEFRWRTKDGQLRWVVNYLSPLVENGGGVVGLRGVALDITDRKLAEETARRTEERNAAIVTAIPDLMFVQSRDGVYLDYNANSPDDLLLSPDTFLGKSMRDVLPPDLAERFEASFERAWVEAGPQVVEYELVQNDERRCYEARIVRSGENILSVVREITERKVAEEGLRESQLLLANELADVKQLQKISLQLQSEDDVEALYDKILEGIIKLVKSDAGAIQALDPERGELDLMAWKGFPDEAAAYWRRVHLKSNSSCGEALRRHERVIIPDLDTCDFLAGTEDLNMYRAYGVRAMQSTPLLSRHGRIVGMISTHWGRLHQPSESELRLIDVVARQVADLLERRRADVELRDSEHRLRLAQHAARIGTWEWKIETGESVWSEMIWDLLKLEPGSIATTFENFKSFIHPDDRVRVQQSIEKVIAEGSEYYDEFRIINPDGDVIWLTSKGALQRDKDGRPERMLGVNMDITERKIAEEAIRESEERFRNMAETAPVMIWMSDETQATTYVSSEWLKMTGGTLEDEIGLGWTRHVHPDDVAVAVEKGTEAFKNRTPFELEFRILSADGSYRWLLSAGRPRMTPDGDFRGYIGTAMDITDRKEAESELIQAHEELSNLKNQLEAENIYLQEELRQDQAFGDIVGQSTAIKYVLYKVSQVAPLDSTVLIMGETGTGKELVARAIHEASPRKDRPLIRVNCSALSPSLIESELFGHEKGAFTGAGSRKLGRFELANTGTLLLDEIGELPLDLQSKLLRVLQEGEFERVGSGRTIKTDARIIALTNRDLKKEVEKGKFREDLWYRLNVFPITTPPLRDRRDDIPLLTEHFARTFARKFGKTLNAVSPDTLSALCTYTWPGNVRELANVIERAIINLRGDVLKIHEDFPIQETEMVAASVKTLDDMERDHIIRVLEDLHWRVDGPQGAARVLGINPSTLRTRMAKLGIQKPVWKPAKTSH